MWITAFGRRWWWTRLNGRNRSEPLIHYSRINRDQSGGFHSVRSTFVSSNGVSMKLVPVFGVVSIGADHRGYRTHPGLLAWPGIEPNAASRRLCIWYDNCKMCFHACNVCMPVSLGINNHKNGEREVVLEVRGEANPNLAELSPNRRSRHHFDRLI